MEDIEIMNSLLIFKQNRGRRTNTLIGYKEDLTILFDEMSKLLNTTGIENIVKKLNVQFCMDFFDSLNKNIPTERKRFKIDRQYAARSLNKKMSEMKEMLNHCVRLGIINNNPLQMNECYAVEKTEKVCLSLEEINKLCYQIQTENVKGRKNQSYLKLRDEFIYKLLFTTGLRFSEMYYIQLDWIEEYRDHAFINIPAVYVKNKIDKRVPITNQLINLYRDYIDERSKINIKEDSKNYLFLSANGRKINKNHDNDFNTNLRKRALAAGINKHITIHGFRHSFSTQTNLQGKDKVLINAVGGWEKGNGIAFNTYCSKNNTSMDQAKLECCSIL